MKILVADDSRTIRKMLRATLADSGYEILEATDGWAALRALQSADAPRLALLDWVMPSLSGPEVCRQIRVAENLAQPYILLLTVKHGRKDVLEGFQAGADDFLGKPFDPEELRARVHVGARIIRLRDQLQQQVKELSDALSTVERLEGMLPICSYCRKVRDDKDYWQQVETYLSEHTKVKFTHGICPDCIHKAYEPGQ